jgi:plasmid stabilization system protein ParE
MSVLRRHPLVRADISEAFNWYEDQQPGLGLEFAADFLAHYRQLAHDAQLYAVRFADVRRLNLDRFPYGLFYVIRWSEIWLLAVLHASRDTETILAERRREFRK